jgi:hypothetical protein
MTGNRDGFVRAGPGRHGAHHEAEGLRTSGAELEVRAHRDGQGAARSNRGDLFVITEFPPDLSLTRGDIPDLIDLAVDDSPRDLAWMQGAVCHAAPADSHEDANLGTIRREDIVRFPELSGRELVRFCGHVASVWAIGYRLSAIGFWLLAPSAVLRLALPSRRLVVFSLDFSTR